LLRHTFAVLFCAFKTLFYINRCWFFCRPDAWGLFTLITSGGEVVTLRGDIEQQLLLHHIKEILKTLSAILSEAETGLKVHLLTE